MNQSREPLKIGILFEYPSLNGGEFSMLAVLDSLALHSPLGGSRNSPAVGTAEDSQAQSKLPKLAPVILGPENGPLAAECQRAGLQYEPLELEELAQNPTLFVSRLNAIIDAQKLQLVHANSLSAGRKLGRIASELSCLTSSHFRDIIKLSQAAIRDLNQHAGLIAVSEATRNFHVAQGVDPQRIVTIVNGIDPQRFAPTASTGWLRRELGLPDDAVLAAVIGQICLRKGQDDVAHAAVLLRDCIPQLHILLIGQRYSSKDESVAFDDELTRVFVAAQMESRLVRLGWRKEMTSIYPELDLLVHPARQEPLGRVLLEAAACGVPIVATDVGGTSEIVVHQESAWLVPPKSPVELANGIEYVWNHPEIRRQYQIHGRNRILSRFTIEQSSQSHLSFWTQLIERVDTGKSVEK
ncbi:glycosyltransferase [Planctomicrobium sp. SH527]|uniref:glycosyltransferase n=1 Tax=Planctomicrobium sp. SH527 TaxID=3448123 RepID=UPI003F5B70BD